MEVGKSFALDSQPCKNQPQEVSLNTGKDAVKCRQHLELADDTRIYSVDYLVDIDPYLVDMIEHKLRTKVAGNGS